MSIFVLVVAGRLGRHSTEVHAMRAAAKHGALAPTCECAEGNGAQSVHVQGGTRAQVCMCNATQLQP